MSSFLERTKATFRNSVNETTTKRTCKQVLSFIEETAIRGEGSIILTKFAVKSYSDRCIFECELRESERDYLVNELKNYGFSVTQRDSLTFAISGWSAYTNIKPTPIPV